ncbi:hypothetical protein, partial [Escherichia coli]|uniref:hypothetical protein n=1 Tax=Escherichia coli TaxID=562 RepID=UPI0030C6BE86
PGSTRSQPVRSFVQTAATITASKPFFITYFSFELMSDFRNLRPAINPITGAPKATMIPSITAMSLLVEISDGTSKQ